jgi:hypothetical protein
VLVSAGRARRSWPQGYPLELDDSFMTAVFGISSPPSPSRNAKFLGKASETVSCWATDLRQGDGPASRQALPAASEFAPAARGLYERRLRCGVRGRRCALFAMCGGVEAVLYPVFQASHACTTPAEAEISLRPVTRERAGGHSGPYRRVDCCASGPKINWPRRSNAVAIQRCCRIS